MATIGKIQGWNIIRTFWVSYFTYMAIMIFPIFLILNYYASTDFAIFIQGAGISIGLLLCPFINLGIKRVYADVFTKSPSSLTYKNSKNQDVVEKEPSIQKQPSNSGNSGLRPNPQPDTRSDNKHTVDTRSGHIFVSYRRSDSADVAGRIYDRLIGKFGRERIFKDVDSIPLGLDFKEYLDKKVGECDVLLAIIGDRWLDAKDLAEKYRLEDPDDFVRIEIQSALERGIPVIPLLVRDAHMPREESLPSSLRKLVYRNGIPIRSDPDFHRDMDRLIAALEKYVPEDK